MVGGDTPDKSCLGVIRKEPSKARVSKWVTALLTVSVSVPALTPPRDGV